MLQIAIVGVMILLGSTESLIIFRRNTDNLTSLREKTVPNPTSLEGISTSSKTDLRDGEVRKTTDILPSLRQHYKIFSHHPSNFNELLKMAHQLETAELSYVHEKASFFRNLLHWQQNELLSLKQTTKKEDTQRKIIYKPPSNKAFTTPRYAETEMKNQFYQEHTAPLSVIVNQQQSVSLDHEHKSTVKDDLLTDINTMSTEKLPKSHTTVEYLVDHHLTEIQHGYSDDQHFKSTQSVHKDKSVKTNDKGTEEDSVNDFSSSPSIIEQTGSIGHDITERSSNKETTSSAIFEGVDKSEGDYVTKFGVIKDNKSTFEFTTDISSTDAVHQKQTTYKPISDLNEDNIISITDEMETTLKAEVMPDDETTLIKSDISISSVSPQMVDVMNASGDLEKTSDHNEEDDKEDSEATFQTFTVEQQTTLKLKQEMNTEKGTKAGSILGTSTMKVIDETDISKFSTPSYAKREEEANYDDEETVKHSEKPELMEQ